jgi:hypothetical protein
METLPKDLVNKLTEELSAQDMISFCQSHLHPNVKKLCNSNDFWRQRFIRDFPFLISYFPDLGINAKHIYLSLFSKISRKAEEFAYVVLDTFGTFKQFIVPEYKKKLYTYFYNSFVYSIRACISNVKDNKIEYDEIDGITNETIYDLDELEPPKYSKNDRLIERLDEFWVNLIKNADETGFLVEIMKDLNIQVIT